MELCLKLAIFLWINFLFVPTCIYLFISIEKNASTFKNKHPINLQNYDKKFN